MTDNTKDQTPTNQTTETTKTTETTPPETTTPTDQQIENGDEAETDENEVVEEITPFTTTGWDTKKTKLKEQFPQLTEEDLNYEEGKHSELYARLQSRLQKTNEEVKNLVDGVDKTGL